MSSINDYIKRAAERTGFKREHFLEKNMPTEPSNVVVVPFYGDLKSTFVLSSLLLKSYKELNIGKYFILCSWPGFSQLFPYADEFWHIDDEAATRTLATEANNFYNASNLSAELTRNLSEVLNIITARDLTQYYNNGFTQKFWHKFGEIKRFFPNIPPINANTSDFKIQVERSSGKRIIVYPVNRMQSRQNGKTVYLPVSKDFWIALIERLLDAGFSPIVYQNVFTYDVSGEFTNRCNYLVARNMMDVLAAFRYVGLVLDVFSGISRLATMARCPFLAVTERQIFVENKDYELDDLTCRDLPHQYIFSFSTMLMTGGKEEWNISLLDNICAKLDEFISTIDTQNLPSTNQSYEVISYDVVRHKKAKRLGAKFIKNRKELDE